jgi:hypothetical protein
MACGGLCMEMALEMYVRSLQQMQWDIDQHITLAEGFYHCSLLRSAGVTIHNLLRPANVC